MRYEAAFLRRWTQKRRVRAPPKLTHVRNSPDLRKGVIRILRVRAAPCVAFSAGARLTRRCGRATTTSRTSRGASAPAPRRKWCAAAAHRARGAPAHADLRRPFRRRLTGHHRLSRRGQAEPPARSALLRAALRGAGGARPVLLDAGGQGGPRRGPHRLRQRRARLSRCAADMRVLRRVAWNILTCAACVAAQTTRRCTLEAGPGVRRPRLLRATRWLRRP